MRTCFCWSPFWGILERLQAARIVRQGSERDKFLVVSRIEFWFSAADLAIGSRGVDVVSEAAISVLVILSHFQLPREKDHRNHAALSIGWLERSHVTIDGGHA